MENFGKLKGSKRIKLGPKHGFKECLIYGPKFPQTDTIIGKTENFQAVFC